MFLKGKLFLGIALLGILFIAAGACTEVSEDIERLEDTRWVLESYGDEGNLKSVIEGSRITATFESDEHQVRGSAGCNTYFGEYEVSGNNMTIRHVASTEMACLEPEGVMEQESEYLGILIDADSYETQDGWLRINAGSQVLVFGIE